MLRTLAAIAAFGLLFSAFDASAAAKGGPPYKLDAKGNCHDSAGKTTAKSNCAAPPATPAAAPAVAAKGGPPYKLDAQGNCHDSAGRTTSKSNCPAPMAASVLAPKSGPSAASASAKPHCTTGKPCGNACIKATDVCHKPG